MERLMEVVLLFFCYSFLGWAWETVYVSLKQKHFAYRGFLVGPITPIYGFAILGVLYFLQPFTQNIVLLFIGAFIICSIAEFVTSWVLEKLFHASWWDYHDVPFNIQGRVALPISIFWGICCVVIVKEVQPFLLEKVRVVLAKTGDIFPILFSSIMTVDLIYTIISMAGFAKFIGELNTSLAEKKDEMVTGLQEIRESLAEKKENMEGLVETRGKKLTQWLTELKQQPERLRKIPHMTFHQRRLLKSFDRVNFKNSAFSREEIRRFIQELQRKK